MLKNQVSNGTGSNTHPQTSRIRYALISIVALGILLRLWHIGWGLPEIYEEAMPLKISWQIWNWGKSGLDFNPHFFVYPALTFYLHYFILFIQYIVGHLGGVYSSFESFHKSYEADPSSFVTVARVVMLLFDMGSLILTYLLASLYSNRKVGLIAAFLVAINPLHIQRTHLINVDTPLTFFVMLSLLFIYKFFKSPELKWYLLAGVGVGLATATKYNGALLVLVFIVAHLVRYTSFTQAIRSLKDIRLISGIAIAGLVFAVFNPYIFIRFNDFLTEFSQVQRHMESGHLGLDAGKSTLEYYLLQSLPQNLGWPLLVIIVVSVIYLLLRKKAADWVILAFPIIYFSTIGSWAMRDDRYIFPIFPILILIASIGLFAFWNWLSEYFREQNAEKWKRSRIFRFGVVIACGLFIIVPPLSHTLEYQKTAGLPNTRALVKKWIMENVRIGSSIATGPFAIEMRKGQFLVLPIPFNAGYTEKTIPFYDPHWYEDIDLVITSDYDYARYAQEPERLHDILQFYDTLRTRWTLVYEAKPSDTTTGPTFWIYHYPGSSGESFDSVKIQNLETNGDSSEVINFIGKLGLILQMKGKLSKSEQLLREVLLLDPNNLTAVRNLTIIQDKLGKYAELLAEARRYLQFQPEDPEIIALEGKALMYLGQIEQAEIKLKEALNFNNHLESAYLDLTILYSLLNEKQKIINVLTQYLGTLPPESRKAQLIEQQLQALKKGS